MSLYPSLEDMQVDQMQQAQHAVAQHMSTQQQGQLPYPVDPTAAGAPAYGSTSAPSTAVQSIYPSLNEYMGLDLALVPQMPPQQPNQV